ncbi:MAG TPA: ATP-binding protein [Solirubrobacteraceae bacterium]|nr:ATP-binding protein [Solirubrobacteraceae bacterium]
MSVRQRTAVRETYAADPASVTRARRVAMEVARGSGLGRAGCADVALAVSEACTNVVLHAFRDNRHAPPEFVLEAWPVDDGVRVVVADQGQGMGPNPDSPGLGLGLAVIARVAESCEVRRARPTGTELRLTFRA